jgi:hypothetical protein
MFELLPPSSGSTYTANNSTTTANAPSKVRKEDRTRSMTLKRSAFALSLVSTTLHYAPLIISTAALALILGFAGRLSRSFAKSACTLGGDFVVPLTSSIWDASSFFEIIIPFIGPRPNSCSHSGSDPFGNRDCIGYSFTQVKVMGLA